MSNLTLVLLCLVAFLVIRGLLRGRRRRSRALLSDSTAPRDGMIAGLLLSDFTWQSANAGDAAAYYGGHHGIDGAAGGFDASSGGAFDGGGFSGGGDTGGGGMGGG